MDEICSMSKQIGFNDLIYYFKSKDPLHSYSSMRNISVKKVAVILTFKTK